jgi:hypothetical protein
MIRKILFPFFRKRHRFLMGKWWFRLLVVGYATVLIFLVVYPWHYISSYPSRYCSERIGPGFSYAECIDTWGGRGSVLDIQIFPYIFVSIVVLHYLVQLVFFRILVDFVVLDNNTNNTKHGLRSN